VSSIDPLTGLAFSIYSGKGIYALLLGSGVSRSAGIPTGWEITLDLIRRIAAAEGLNCEPDPVAWYRERFGLDADYSNLLEKLALTPAERAKMLASYFERTVDERETDKKRPTKAHHTIAKMVAAGYIRVIITTNFDRLMEQALETEGVSPSVVAGSDDVAGCMPLTHSRCTLIKVHGDYLDTRIKNTVEELSSYSPEMDMLLDRVLDEYGLIVCGWSANWDFGLRKAIRRSPNRRFSLWWATRGTTPDEAKELVAFRQGTELQISSADDLFSEVWGRVEALERFNAPHPLSAALAVISLKKLLSEDKHRIELSELVRNETEKQVEILSRLSGHQLRDCEDYLARLTFYNSSLEIIGALVVNGCFWGRTKHNANWARIIVRLADSATLRGGSVPLEKLRRYPAFLLMYAGGLAALAAQNYEFLQILFHSTTSVDASSERKTSPLLAKISATEVFDFNFLKGCLGKSYHTPASEYLYQTLRQPMREMVPSDYDFETLFDRFEYLLALSFLRDRIKDNKQKWAPVGRFAYRRVQEIYDISAVLLDEWKLQGAGWPPIVTGVFSDANEFLALDKMLKEQVLVHTQQWY
jgi:hypothetical protein